MNCEQAKKIQLIDYFHSIGMQAQNQKANEFWYKSPFVGEQKTGSLKVSLNLNKWYCHNIGRGGNLLDFVMLLHSCDLQTALQIIAKQVPTSTFVFQQQNIPAKEIIAEKGKETVILKVNKLENKTLVDYLCIVRKIPYPIAVRYCKEVYHSNIERQAKNLKPFFSIGFQNDLQGYELRNEFFKSGSSPKTITTIKGRDSSKVCIFEGFIDFLSALVYFKKPYCEYDVIVLNSVSNLSHANLGNYQAIKLYLDNDLAGKQTSNSIKTSFANVVDYSFLYADHKDFNEWISAKKQNPFAKS